MLYTAPLKYRGWLFCALINPMGFHPAWFSGTEKIQYLKFCEFVIFCDCLPQKILQIIRVNWLPSMLELIRASRVLWPYSRSEKQHLLEICLKHTTTNPHPPLLDTHNKPIEKKLLKVQIYHPPEEVCALRKTKITMENPHLFHLYNHRNRVFFQPTMFACKSVCRYPRDPITF